jgi:hypothetical protein
MDELTDDLEHARSAKLSSQITLNGIAGPTSTSVNVFPVPGGPWMHAISANADCQRQRTSRREQQTRLLTIHLKDELYSLLLTVVEVLVKPIDLGVVLQRGERGLGEAEEHFEKRSRRARWQHQLAVPGGLW